VRARGHVDDPPLGRPPQLLQQQVRQQEVAEVIDPQLGLEPVPCRLPLHGDDARVVDQHIQRRVSALELASEVPDALERAEVAQHELELVRAAALEGLLQRLRTPPGIAARHDDGGAPSSQLRRGGEPHARIRTGHDYGLPIHVAVLWRESVAALKIDA